MHIYLNQDPTNLKIKQYMLDNEKMELDMAKANNIGLMAVFMKDIGQNFYYKQI